VCLAAIYHTDRSGIPHSEEPLPKRIATEPEDPIERLSEDPIERLSEDPIKRLSETEFLAMLHAHGAAWDAINTPSTSYAGTTSTGRAYSPHPPSEAASLGASAFQPSGYTPPKIPPEKLSNLTDEEIQLCLHLGGILESNKLHRREGVLASDWAQRVAARLKSMQLSFAELPRVTPKTMNDQMSKEEKKILEEEWNQTAIVGSWLIENLSERGSNQKSDNAKPREITEKELSTWKSSDLHMFFVLARLPCPISTSKESMKNQIMKNPRARMIAAMLELMRKVPSMSLHQAHVMERLERSSGRT